jgi:hypothetical protein
MSCGDDGCGDDGCDDDQKRSSNPVLSWMDVDGVFAGDVGEGGGVTVCGCVVVLFANKSPKSSNRTIMISL